MNKDQREIQRKLRILRHAEETGHINKTCRYFGFGRSSFFTDGGMPTGSIVKKA